jgi:hypothetical protein
MCKSFGIRWKLHLQPNSHIAYCELVAKLQLPRTKLVTDRTILGEARPELAEAWP